MGVLRDSPIPGLERCTFRALGTLCTLQVAEENLLAADAFFAAATAWVRDFEARYSRYRPDSVISRLNAQAGGDWQSIDAGTEHLLQLAGGLYTLSDGLLDVATLPLAQLWNWKQPPLELPTPAQVRRALALCGWPKVERRPGALRLPLAGMGLDVGGFGKEYAVDQVLQMAIRAGLEHVLVDFGGDVAVRGHPPGQPFWHIGVEDPVRPGVAASGVGLSTGQAMATSGDSVRAFERGGRRYGHIIDPRSGYPANSGLLGVSVVAGSCLEAGMLATVCFILGPEAGLERIARHPSAAGRLSARQRVWQTPNYAEHEVLAA